MDVPRPREPARAGARGPFRPLAGWRAERDAVHVDVLANGYDRQVGAFTLAYGSSALDAALLQIPLLDFLPPDDARVTGTLEAIASGLSLAPEAPELIRRYDTKAAPDGLPGEEGAFLLCSFDLVSVLILAGRVKDAEERFERLLGRAGPLGLFSEEMDATGVMLGNFPQAFTHLALIEAALNVDEWRDRETLHEWATERGPRIREAAHE
jgi:alpha,alpha-trehalase